MEWLQSLLDSSTTPALTAFLLGLLTAISPCPLATKLPPSVLLEKTSRTATGYFETVCSTR